MRDFKKKLTGENLLFYRGVDISVKEKLKSLFIGPSPASKDGRYNREGERCLYLITDIEPLKSELKSSELLVQEYYIPVDRYKIADLASDNSELHNNLAIAFHMAERGATPSGYDIEKELEKRRRSKYSFSQLLASIFKRYNWDGLYIPGVHGSPGKYYCNMAIFDSIIDQWESWVKPGYYPKNID
ncbi:MAG: hypothetical protein AB1847_14095 [bacterium]